MTFAIDERLAVERFEVTQARPGEPIEREELGRDLILFEAKARARIIHLERPVPPAPEEGEFRARSFPAEFLHAVNSKTPSTRIATNRRGRNREEAVRYERSRRFG